MAATVTALAPSFRGLQFMQKFFTWHKKQWPKGRRKYVGPNFLKDSHSIEKCPDAVPTINWAYGFAHKFRLPITCLDFDLPEHGSAYILEHPAVARIFHLEHQDPDVRSI